MKGVAQALVLAASNLGGLGACSILGRIAPEIGSTGDAWSWMWSVAVALGAMTTILTVCLIEVTTPNAAPPPSGTSGVPRAEVDHSTVIGASFNLVEAPIGSAFGRVLDEQFYRFETRRITDLAHATPRTVGAVIWPHDFSSFDSAHAIKAHEALLTRRGRTLPSGSAKGKVTVVSTETLKVFQVSHDGESAALCGCGNATAAGLALLALASGECLGCTNRSRLILPDGEVFTSAQVLLTVGGGSLRVTQSWSGLEFAVTELPSPRRRLAVCSGMNHYVIVLATPPDFEKFGLGDVEALLQFSMAHRGATNPLQWRLVVLSSEPEQQSHTRARFYSCGRMHPGAPLTGLATLALAAKQIDWLAEILRTEVVEHPRGIDQLPTIEGAVDGPRILFNPIDVSLQRSDQVPG
jgi:hypothetical protein